MKGVKIGEIKKEIEAIGLRVENYPNGLLVYPSEESEYIIQTNELEKLIRIAQKYNMGHYINFERGFVRLHE